MTELRGKKGKILPNKDKRCKFYIYQGDHPRLINGLEYSRHELALAFNVSTQFVSEHCKNLNTVTDDVFVFLKDREGYVHHSSRPKIKKLKPKSKVKSKLQKPAKNNWLSRRLI